MKYYQPFFKLFFVFLFAFSLSEVSAQVFKLPPKAIDAFASQQGLYNGIHQDDPLQWVQSQGGDSLSKNEKGWFVIYKRNFLLYFFGPYPESASCQYAVNKLRTFRDLHLQDVKYIKISAFKLSPEGKQIFPEDDLLEQDAIEFISDEEFRDLAEEFLLSPAPQTLEDGKQQMDEYKRLSWEMLNRSLTGDSDGKRALNNLKKLTSQISKEFDEGSQNTSDSNGSSEAFPVEVPISKWFATMMDVMAEFLLPTDLKTQPMKALTVAYILMPDAFDEIASPIGKLERASTPGNLHTVLNDLADVSNSAFDFYRRIEGVKKLLDSKDFAQVLKSADLGDLASGLADLGIEEINSNGICSRLPCDMLNLQNLQNESSLALSLKLKTDIRQFAQNKVPDLVEKTGLPGLNFLDKEALKSLFEGETSIEQLGRLHIEKAICDKIPGSNCQDIPIDRNIPQNFAVALEDYIVNFSDKELSARESSFRDLLKTIKSEDLGGTASNIRKLGTDKFAYLSGLEPQSFNQALDAVAQSDFSSAYKHAIISTQGKAADFFDNYENNKPQNTNEIELKQAVSNFLNNTIRNSMFNKLNYDTGNYFDNKLNYDASSYFDEVIVNHNSPQNFLRNNLMSYGWDEKVVDNILSGNPKALGSYLSNTLTSEMGFKSTFARNDIADGKGISSALYSESNFLISNPNSSSNGQAQQLATIQVRVKKKKSFFRKIWDGISSIFKKGARLLLNLTTKVTQISTDLIGSLGWRFLEKQIAKWGNDGHITQNCPPGEVDCQFKSGTPHYYYINGMMKTEADSRKSARSIASIVEQPVTLVYSFCHKQLSFFRNKVLKYPGAIADIKDAVDYFPGMATTAATKRLDEQIMNDIRHGRKVVIFAHSRGAALVFSMYSRLSEKTRSITIVTLGGFAPTATSTYWPWPPSSQVIAVCNPGDPVPDLAQKVPLTQLYKLLKGKYKVAAHKLSSYMDSIKMIIRKTPAYYPNRINIK